MPALHSLHDQAEPPLGRDNGGYRAAAVASDHHVARPAFQIVSEPSAESALQRIDRWWCRDLTQIAQFGRPWCPQNSSDRTTIHV